jgi:hypothetical protein
VCVDLRHAVNEGGAGMTEGKPGYQGGGLGLTSAQRVHSWCSDRAV